MTTARERFFPTPDTSPRQRRKHALADHVRQLVDDVLFLDAAAAPEEDLARAEAAWLCANPHRPEESDLAFTDRRAGRRFARKSLARLRSVCRILR